MFDPHALPVPDLGFSCRRCGYALANLPEHRCPECGRPFTLEEYIPAGHAPVLIAGGEQVRATPNVIELFRTYQIPYVERPGPFEAVLGPIRLSRREQAAPIGVPRDHYLEAIDLIRRQMLDEPMPEPPTAAPDQATDWACPACAELNPANFEFCWNCGERAESAP